MTVSVKQKEKKKIMKKELYLNNSIQGSRRRDKVGEK